MHKNVFSEHFSHILHAAVPLIIKKLTPINKLRKAFNLPDYIWTWTALRVQPMWFRPFTITFTFTPMGNFNPIHMSLECGVARQGIEPRTFLMRRNTFCATLPSHSDCFICTFFVVVFRLCHFTNANFLDNVSCFCKFSHYAKKRKKDFFHKSLPEVYCIIL